jgi:hypothetical protein
MQAHTVERVESWDSRPFPGGFRELQDLADAEFSGAVVAGGTWLFALNGRVIGVFEGDIDDFEDATGTVYEAPHPSVALLFSMKERGGETQAKYYTNDTPLSEASETLADANFTGYIELSENVLSGDYYVVYYGGRSMSAAFVGTSEELVTADEAFERADDEVGLYEVKKVPVNVTTIPEPADEPDSSESAGGTTGAVAGASAGATAASESDTGSDEETSQTSSDTEASADDAGGTPASEESPVSNPGQQTRASADDESATETSADARTRDSGAGESGSAESDDAADTGESVTAADRASERAGSASRPRTSAAGGAETDSASAGESSGDEAAENDTSAGASAAAADAADSESGGRVFDEEEQWRNTNSVPTLDPDESESSESSSTSTAKSTSASSGTSAQQTKRAKTSRGGSSGGNATATVEKLKRAVKQRDAKLEEAADRIERLETERDDLDSEHEELRERVDTLQSERDELQSRVEDLEAKLEASDDPGGSNGRDMSPEAALSETNLFVRYGSKGKPTLDELGPESDPDAINQNLRIEHHTQFEADDVTVDGEPFEAFLQQSTAYRFVSWVVRELPFEVRDAGHTNNLADVYEAIPAIDRAELDGTVAVDTEDGSISQTFDVVLRDRMGNPLLVAELNPEREPVTGDEMAALVEAATDVRGGADELSGALYVTASFFEPPALETAEQETGGGGFLSRSDKASYVNVGRKTGYHLCLVEDRNETFHLTVPEL